MAPRTCISSCIALAIAVPLCAPVAAGAQSPFQIVFQSDRAGNSDLWLVGSDGANERPLTQTATPEASPSWSPDGTRVVYACAPASNWELCTIDPATRQATQLTRTAANEFDPRYTSDGRQIVMETYAKGRSNADIAIMPAGGGVPKALTSTPAEDDQDPAPDPNSTRIAFASDGNIEILDSDAPGRFSRVTRGARGNSDPSFSSRDEIAFARPTGRTSDIVVAGRGARREQTRLTQGGTDDIQPAWTADGTQLFFARAQRPGSRQLRIFRMDADGRGEQAVTRGGAYADIEPAPQPVSSGRLRARISRYAAQAAACHTINGNSGANTLNGTTGRDCIHGKAGNDRLTGRQGRDDLFGEANNDRFYAKDGEQDLLSGGGGADEAVTFDVGLDVISSAVLH